MKNFLVVLSLFVIIASAAVMTCPDRHAHEEAVMSEFNQMVKEETGGSVWGMLGGNIYKEIMQSFFDQWFRVENKFLYSTGTLILDDSSKVVTVGAFGHIFVLDEEALRKDLADL